MGSKTINCPVCSKPGYLIKEKPRPKKRRKTDFTPNSREYRTNRRPNPIFEVAHNIKKDGNWRSKRCYLGVYQKVLDFAKTLSGKGEPEWEHMALDEFTKIGKHYKLQDSDVGLPTDLESRQNIANILFHFSGTDKFSLSHKSPIRVKVDPRIPISF